MSHRDKDTKRNEARIERPAHALRREIEPTGDLWAGIARRIDPASSAKTLSPEARDPNAPLAHLTRHLRREVEPVRDLWPAVRRRLEGAETRPVETSETRTSWIGWAGWAVAAAAMVLAFQLPEALNDPPPPASPTVARPEILELPIEQVRLGRLEARTRLRRVLDEDSSISPATRAIVERNLETIDEALAEIQRALTADPGNATLYRLLHATYRQEAEIVAQITRHQHAPGSRL